MLVTAFKALVKWSIIFLALFGVLVIWDDKCNDRPVKLKYTNNMKIIIWSRINTTFDESNHNIEGLKQTLEIVKELNPDIYKWFYQTYNDDNLTITNSNNDYIASYCYLTKELCINKNFFSYNDGKKASTIIHEYKHSRQSFMKYIRCGLSNNKWVVERDAYNLAAVALLCLHQPYEAYNEYNYGF